MEPKHVLQDLWNYYKGCSDCWMITALIIILLFIWVSYRRARRTFFLYQGSTGKVRVSQSALNHLIKDIVEKVGAWQCVDIEFSKSGRQFNLDLKLKANVTQNIPELQERLYSALVYSLGKLLGSESIGNVNLVIVGFKGNIQEVIDSQASSKTLTPLEEFKVLSKKE